MNVRPGTAEMNDEKIMTSRLMLDHGSGGRASQRLIAELFLTYLGNPVLNSLDDGACLDLKGKVAMSTDTFTVDPIFFPGGDIGSLAVHGTVNDVAMLGAVPRYLSCGFILEEGLDLEVLERIVASMGRAAEIAGVQVVTGDTKVVPRGAVDKVFINTTGLGELLFQEPLSGSGARVGDAILVSGSVGDHGLAIFSKREGLSFETEVKSDSAPLNHLIVELLRQVPEVHVLRDPTRGGLATTINEIAQQSGCECVLQEPRIPVSSHVREGCSLLGLDPLYLANEGKFICFLPEDRVQEALEVLTRDETGAGAVRIGSVVQGQPGRVVLETRIGGRRLLNMLEGEQLPRIC